MSTVVVIGLGAIGGTVAALLDIAGVDVAGVARGEHLRAVQQHGLVLRTPVGLSVARVPAYATVEEVDWGAVDVAILAVKSQDTAGVLEQLARCAPRTLTVVTAQNGIENEPLVAAHFPTVAAMVMMPATHLVPGEVVTYSVPVAGILDVGAYRGESPHPGPEPAVHEVSALLRRAGLDSREVADVMAWKRTKLLGNLANVVQVLCPEPGSETESEACDRLIDALRREAEQVYVAASLTYADPARERERRAGVLAIPPAAGARRAGSSTWQSLHRGQPLETDALNGAICRLAAGTARAPLNALVTSLAAEVQSGARRPRTLTPDEVLSMAGA